MNGNFRERLMWDDVEGIKIHAGDSDPDEAPFDLLAGLSKEDIAEAGKAALEMNHRSAEGERGPKSDAPAEAEAAARKC